MHEFGCNLLDHADIVELLSADCMAPTVEEAPVTSHSTSVFSLSGEQGDPSETRKEGQSRAAKRRGKRSEE